jgi:hypothetical protein
VQSVASQAKTYAVKPLASHPRPPVNDRGAPPSPFESLIPDDGTQSASSPDKAAESDRTQATRPAKADGNERQPRTDQAKTQNDSADDSKKSSTDQTATDQTDPADQTKASNVATLGGTVGDGTKDSEKTGSDKTGDHQAKADGQSDAACDAQGTADLVSSPTAGQQAVAAVAVNQIPVAGQTPAAPENDAKASAQAGATGPDVAAIAAAAQTDPADAAIGAAAADKPTLRSPSLARKADANGADAAKEATAENASANEGSETATQAQAPTPDAKKASADGKVPAGVGDADKQSISAARGEKPADTHHAAPDDTQSVSGDSVTATTAKPGADVVQTLSASTPAHNAAAANPTQVTAPNVTVAAVPLSGVAIAITTKALDGKNSFEIRLDPPELGRIEVRLDVDKDGSVTSHLVAHRAETLDLLRRDAGGLQRALQDAGLKTADNGLQFSLHNQTGQQHTDTRTAPPKQLIIPDETLNPIEPATNSYAQLASLRGGVDIRV